LSIGQTPGGNELRKSVVEISVYKLMPTATTKRISENFRIGFN